MELALALVLRACMFADARSVRPLVATRKDVIWKARSKATTDVAFVHYAREGN
jgi:hypothetical protein